MGTLRIKSSIELKSQIQDFLAVSPYAEQLQGLLALSEEELQNPNAVQKFLEQQHLDSQIWTEYIDKLKVRKLLEKNQYFVNLDARWQKPLLETNFDLISFFSQHGFLGEDISKT